MKKLLSLIMIFAMIFSLVACGGGTDEETSIPSQSETSVADEQAKADEDYAKLEGFLNRIVENYTAEQEIAPLLEEVKSGEKEESALLDVYRNLAADSNEILQELENTTWETAHYDEQISALNDCVELLAQYQEALYEASSENDEARLEEGAELLNEYDAKLGIFLDSMGVE